MNIIQRKSRFPQANGAQRAEKKIFLLNWSRLVNFLSLFLLYSIILAYFGFFRLSFLFGGALILFFLFKGPVVLLSVFQFFGERNLLGVILSVFFLIWLGSIVYFFPFPCLSGRDEGSYANAAILLAKEGKMYFHPEIFDILKNEGPAHQSLNFPGFVVQDGSLFSQFSPAYFVYLAIFYLIWRNVYLWGLANGLLIIFGWVAFFQVLKKVFPAWVAAAGVLVLLTHFVFLWFPRFTFSENLAFFLLWNLVLFLFLFRLEPARKNYLVSAILLAVLFPLTRPEGWWVLLATTILLIFWRREIFQGRGEIKRKIFLSFFLLLLLGLGTLLKLVFLEAPVYKRLLKDWIKWKETGQYFNSLRSGGSQLENVKEIVFSLFPPLEKLVYFWKVEWNYGVLFFGLAAVLFFFVFLWAKKIFSEREKILGKILFFVHFPFFVAFVSPQISADHPFLLRRFLFGVLPCGVAAALFLVCKMTTKKNNFFAFLRPVMLALLILPSLFASTYYLPVKTSVARAEMLAQLGTIFQKDDFVFLHRESSGNGWQMWSEPLWSIYGVNSAYVYDPNNIVANKQFIVEKWQKGRKFFVILPNEAYDFEHQLQKEFNLFLEKEIKFSDDELDLAKGWQKTSFPLLRRKEIVAKIYMLVPK